MWLIPIYRKPRNPASAKTRATTIASTTPGRRPTSALAPMLNGLAKHVAVISGGGSGLGRATAEHLVKSGARVVLLDLPSSDGAVVAERLGENATFCPTDVTSEEQVSAALDLAESLYGEPVSSAISCAGILHAAKTVSRKGVAYPLDAFSRVLHVNVVGTFNVSRLAAQRMVARAPDEDGQRGVIVNTASIAAFDGQAGRPATRRHCARAVHVGPFPAAVGARVSAYTSRRARWLTRRPRAR
jgi:NAD(P)-dependent dehydrogenase (short-subunit alcohol dehydrogenase family)